MMIRFQGDLSELAELAKRSLHAASNRAYVVSESTVTPLIVWGREREEIHRLPIRSPLQSDRRAVDLEYEHRAWLTRFDRRHLEAWDRLLDSDFEAALTEAGVRRFLVQCGVDVRPNETANDLNRSPDFSCEMGGTPFYVEATCISILDAASETHIPYVPKRGLHAAAPLTEFVRNKCRAKVTQLANLDAPAVLAVGCFHEVAADMAFDEPHVDEIIVGESSISRDVELHPSITAGDDYQSTELANSSVLRSGSREGEIDVVRRPISALLLFSFHIQRPRVIGVVHPDAVRPFDLKLLPDVRFGTVVRSDGGIITLNWPQESS